jgi:hypothetical protein
MILFLQPLAEVQHQEYEAIRKSVELLKPVRDAWKDLGCVDKGCMARKAFSIRLGVLAASTLLSGLSAIGAIDIRAAVHIAAINTTGLLIAAKDDLTGEEAHHTFRETLKRNRL